VIEEGTEPDQRFDGTGCASAVFVEHLSLGIAIAAEQRADQQAVMLIEFLQGEIGGSLQFHESLLTATTEQGSVH